MIRLAGDIREAIDHVTRCKMSDFSDFNIVYDSKMTKIRIREADEWKDMTIKNGLRFIVEKLKEYHMDNYESYLIRKMESNSIDATYKTRCKELLNEYYMFLSCFNLEPYIVSSLEEIIPDGDIYKKMYKDIAEKLTVSKQNQVKNDLLDIIKSNGKQNIPDFNKHLSSLFMIDTEFKSTSLT